MGRQENYFERVRGGSSAVTKGNAVPALERCNFPQASPWKSHFILSAMHKFEENNLPALFSLHHQRRPCASQRDSFQTLLSVLLSVRFCALILLPKCPLFKPRTSLSPLLFYITYHFPSCFSSLLCIQNFGLKSIALTQKQAPAFSVWCLQFVAQVRVFLML